MNIVGFCVVAGFVVIAFILLDNQISELDYRLRELDRFYGMINDKVKIMNVRVDGNKKILEWIKRDLEKNEDDLK